ncbi:MAG: PQQ-dependent sugar dehydrogenase [Gammaproteobacteria bacterium]|nr:PQQ-dependent sugar dehydrogenase [Gammaproteobacteria bacterium]
MKEILLLLFVFNSVAVLAQQTPQDDEEDEPGLRALFARFGDLYQDNCAVCHGGSFEGAAQGTPLIGVELIHGDGMDEITRSIRDGYPDKGMPAWSETFTGIEIQSLSLWIKENREGMLITDIGLNRDIVIPTDTIQTEHHALRLEVLIDGLDMSFSIAPLPDGRLLLTEKSQGLSIISAAGEQSDYITGTPEVYGERGSFGGLGWLLDVTLYPDYESNGWIYLHYSERCEDCNATSRETKRPVSMNALVRGRIRNGEWVDEESIWKAPIDSYTGTTDIATGGRTAMDPEGFVFISVGFKTMDGNQDLASPHGKIHRIHDDGRIPEDNPFIDDPGAMATIWSYGHRSPQGLEFNAKTRQLWGTEHGPRGGDEINLLKPGRNYGWPAFSKGQNYDGSEVNHGRADLELELEDIEQPVVDLTPSPGVSSLVFYDGEAFPGWRGDIIVATLKASDLFRVEIDDGKFVSKEPLIENLARIRDVEIGAGGILYLLLEHAAGSKIVRVVPAEPEAG